MRCWQVRGAFGLDRLALVDAPAPQLRAGEVRLRMLAWSLNYRDLLMAKGRYDPKLPLPYVPLSDGVGEVTATGEGVTRVAVGDRVCPTFSPGWIDGAPTPDAVRRTRGGPVPGLLASEVVLPEAELVKVPAHLSDAEAATLPCAGVTAWSAVATHGRVGPGSTVLVLGTGGVSLWALTLARAHGARVVATTSSEARAERLRGLGAAHVVLHTADAGWGRTIRRWSDGGVDLVIEVGGAGTLEGSLDAVRVGGTVAVIGNVAGSREPLSVLPILMKQVRCQGVFVGPRRAFEDLCVAVDRHALRPVVDRTFAFDTAPAAFAWMDAGAHVGKVCLAA